MQGSRCCLFTRAIPDTILRLEGMLNGLEEGAEDLPWVMNATLVTHKLVAIAMAILFLFQIATLKPLMRSWPGREGPQSIGRAYMRTTIKREAAAMPR